GDLKELLLTQYIQATVPCPDAGTTTSDRQKCNDRARNAALLPPCQGPSMQLTINSEQDVLHPINVSCQYGNAIRFAKSFYCYLRDRLRLHIRQNIHNRLAGIVSILMASQTIRYQPKARFWQGQPGILVALSLMSRMRNTRRAPSQSVSSCGHSQPPRELLSR